MIIIDEEFKVPEYICQEIIEYKSMNEEGYSKTMKLESLRILLNVAVVNKRLTKEQAKYLLDKYR